MASHVPKFARPRAWALPMILLMMTTSLAAAAIPSGTSEEIVACYHLKSGALRVIDADAGAKCLRSEVRLSWNQEGPQGPQGPAGPTGLQGPAGPPGPIGPAGPAASLDADSVDTVHLKDAAVTASKLAAGAVTGDAVGEDEITSRHIPTGAIGNDDIASVDGSKVTGPVARATAADQADSATTAGRASGLTSDARVPTDQLSGLIHSDQVAANASWSQSNSELLSETDSILAYVIVDARGLAPHTIFVTGQFQCSCPYGAGVSYEVRRTDDADTPSAGVPVTVSPTYSVSGVTSGLGDTTVLPVSFIDAGVSGWVQYELVARAFWVPPGYEDWVSAEKVVLNAIDLGQSQP